MCLRQPFQLLTSSPVPVKDNTCNKNETFAANNEKKKTNKKNRTTEFQLLRNNERKTETNKQSNKTLGGYIKGLREHLTTAPGKTAVRMVLAGIQKIIILYTLLK